MEKLHYKTEFQCKIELILFVFHLTFLKDLPGRCSGSLRNSTRNSWSKGQQFNAWEYEAAQTSQYWILAIQWYSVTSRAVPINIQRNRQHQQLNLGQASTLNAEPSHSPSLWIFKLKKLFENGCFLNFSYVYWISVYKRKYLSLLLDCIISWYHH